MSWHKRLFRNTLTQNLLTLLVIPYIRLVYATSHKQYLFAAEAMPYMHGEKPALFAFWHGRMLMIPPLRPPGRHMHVMISRHADGRFIARAIQYFGFSVISGSTGKGGMRAAATAIRTLMKGDNVAITPDGPRGPACQAQLGVAVIAARAGVPVVPLSFSASRCKIIRSWDRFRVALPCGRLVLAAAAPILIDPQASDETLQSAAREIENSLNTLTRQADAAVLTAGT